MSSNLDDAATSCSPSSRRATDEEQRAVELAQASIDGYHTSDWSPSASQAVVDQVEVEKLSIVLELIGRLGADSSCNRDRESDQPLRIGRYEVIGERGRGGFGIVLKAMDSLLQREVALKIPRPERLLAGQALDELVREARLIAKLSHPGIVRVYEVRRWGPVWYIASDYCDGPTLAQWLRSQQTPPALRTIVEVMAATADAVQYAHSRGVLHLDLKPDNILLEVGEADAPPRPMVTDFGLSHGSESKIDDQERVGGTLTYMAPEQKARDVELIGVATDVYALGIMLAELVRASQGMERADAPTQGHRAELCGQAALLDLIAVCRRCAAENPTQRYASAKEFADDLRRFLQRKPVEARPLSRPLKVAYFVRRKPLASAMIAALAATILISCVAVITAWRESERHLASLIVSERQQREAADRTEKSLLRLASFAQEAKLRMAHANAETHLIFPDMQEFLLEARRWAEVAPNSPHANDTVEAAVKSMNLVEEGQAGSGETVDEQFQAGLAAWLRLIREAPDEARWRQALALHLFTYKLREGDGKWLSWRSSDLIPDAKIKSSVEAPYALLLIDYTRARLRHQNAGVSYGMLISALEILDDDQVAASLDDQQRLYWRILANQLAATAAKENWRPESTDAHQAVAAQLIATSPEPKDCDARLAALIGEGLVLEGKRRSKFDDAAARKSFERATAYAARAVEAAPEHWPYILALVHQQRRLANQYRDGNQLDACIESLNLALQALDGGLMRCGNIRQLITERAKLLTLLAEDHLDRTDRASARQLLETAVVDFAALELTSRDSRATWLNYGRALMLLTKVHAAENRETESRETCVRLIRLTAQMRSFTNHPRLQSLMRQAQHATATLPGGLADTDPSL